MERWQRYLMVGLAALVTASGIFSVGFALGRDEVGPSGAGPEAIQASELIQEAYDKIVTESVGDLNERALARAAIKGMIEALQKQDPYAFFYSPKSYQSFQELTTGKFSGIGVWLKTKGSDLQIVSVLPDTPAVSAGLERGDVITAIDGEPVSEISTDDAVALIKGKVGTSVQLDVLRGEEELSFEIERAEIDLPNLQARMTDNDLGYVKLFGFARHAGDQVRTEVDALLDAGAEGIILDLRDNGGGLFEEAIEVASVFIEEGAIVTYQDPDDEFTYEATGNARGDVPLVVLVNEGTASASEIVAGALQDRDRAVIIGTTTYGKGSVQTVESLSDASAVKFTTAAYITPDGRNINGKGIDPDVRVEPGPMEGPDVQFRRAADILRGIVLSESGAQG
jgi:carboxyl-terminal processing protease